MEEKEKLREDMELGKKDETVYDEAGRQKLVEDGEMSPEEAGFMEGAEDDGEQGKCAYCGAAIFKDNTVESRLDGKVFWFCSDEHATKYKERLDNTEEE